MDDQKAKARRRDRRRRRVRKRILGTPLRPRVCVFRSLSHIYAQIIDDMSGRTICAASSRDASLGLAMTGNADAAKAVGKAIAQKAAAIGIDHVIFDRNGFPYHGRVRALAEGAREGGLKF